MTNLQISKLDYLSAFDRVPLDVDVLPAHRLNLEDRQRTNPFPWRGQFSPQLVERLISAFGPREGAVWDSFAGVGTTLWEAARQNLDAAGTEINPAAFTMAESVHFVSLSASARRSAVQAAKKILDGLLGEPSIGPLFQLPELNPSSSAPSAARKLVIRIMSGSGTPERIILSNVLLRSLNAEASPSSEVIHREFDIYANAVLDLPLSAHQPKVFHADARRAPLEDGSINLIITSPPYINVFNYHQNGRRAMEALGWDVLRVARSEFGANRKHRGNRFLTVIQYALDMAEWLREARRVLTLNARVIIIVGRESTVRGVAFRNGELLAAIAEAYGFELIMRQERRFVTRFGEDIAEDILHLCRRDDVEAWDLMPARQVAVDALRAVRSSELQRNVACDLRTAISQAGMVHPSPIMKTRNL